MSNKSGKILMFTTIAVVSSFFAFFAYTAKNKDTQASAQGNATYVRTMAAVGKNNIKSLFDMKRKNPKKPGNHVWKTLQEGHDLATTAKRQAKEEYLGHYDTSNNTKSSDNKNTKAKEEEDEEPNSMNPNAHWDLKNDYWDLKNDYWDLKNGGSKRKRRKGLRSSKRKNVKSLKKK
jgi:hypothetical protein